ncbi:DUF418 domain-containing protein [Robertkochia marina]|uniref:DUF418 domain-containing protein n=1 Tax=Robertkochia marina TaxID=1227945 RepID=A0A4S3LXF1_9FLAO|nr:DUF418 domain-containing protein [Robertkochia marina]THD65865.1 DUF418 domain-containing protein [Robertkochia marina]TRZ41368.1 DUF418 domain-containing protein [Robertkochia marina]
MDNKPTGTTKRIELLDVYRGFAILGIFVVNIVIMNSTFLNQDEFAQQWTSPVDQLSERILQLFFYTKFFPIFSLLFGLGISMQALKWYEKNTLSFSFFARRMFILFLFGILHILLLWSGDVLHLYALLGLLTTVFIKRSNTLILSLSLLVLLFPFYDTIFEQLLTLLNFQPEVYLSDHTGASVNEVIRNGSYAEGVKLRILEYLSNIPMLFGFLAPVALSMFLLGLYLGKNRIHQNIEAFIERIKKPIILITVITNIYRVLFLFVFTKLDIYQMAIARTLFVKLMVLSDVVMGLFYLWLLGWLWQYTPWRKILSPLKYAGRMALTNYIMQSFIGLILFSSVGFSLYETMSPHQTFLTALLVFGFQVMGSKIWLRFFQYGPLEWIWRCFTYKKLLPNKKVA